MKQSRVLEELKRERRRHGEAALRSIKSLKESLELSEREIQRGLKGGPMSTTFVIPSHQLLTEVVERPATFVAHWNAVGLLEYADPVFNAEDRKRIKDALVMMEDTLAEAAGSPSYTKGAEAERDEIIRIAATLDEMEETAAG